MCAAGENKTADYKAPDGCVENEDIVSDYDPNPCEYSWYTCDLISAATKGLEFISSEKKDDCM